MSKLFMESEPIILRPVIEKIAGFGNKRLAKVEIMQAPNYVVAHILCPGDDGCIPTEAIAEVLQELMLSGHKFVMQEPLINEVSAVEYHEHT